MGKIGGGIGRLLAVWGLELRRHRSVAIWVDRRPGRLVSTGPHASGAAIDAILRHLPRVSHAGNHKASREPQSIPSAVSLFQAGIQRLGPQATITTRATTPLLYGHRDTTSCAS